MHTHIYRTMVELSYNPKGFALVQLYPFKSVNRTYVRYKGPFIIASSDRTVRREEFQKRNVRFKLQEPYLDDLAVFFRTAPKIHDVHAIVSGGRIHHGYMR